MNKTLINLLQQYWQQYFEWLFWIMALVLLFIMNANTDAPYNKKVWFDVKD